MDMARNMVMVKAMDMDMDMDMDMKPIIRKNDTIIFCYYREKSTKDFPVITGKKTNHEQ